MIEVPEYHSLAETYKMGVEAGKSLNQSALDALRGEVERQRQAFHEIEAMWVDQTERADAAERRVAEFRQALLSVEAALGPNVHLYDTTSDMARALEVATAALTKESP